MSTSLRTALLPFGFALGMALSPGLDGGAGTPCAFGQPAAAGATGSGPGVADSAVAEVTAAAAPAPAAPDGPGAEAPLPNAASGGSSRRAGGDGTGCAVLAAIPGAAPEIREPFFQLVLAIVAADSLGVWDGSAVQAYVRASGRPTRLPLAHVVRIERCPAAPPLETREGATLRRTWRLTLDEDLNLPMPYTILGYHPGTIRLAREMVFSEWRIGDLDLHVAGKGASGRLAVGGLTVLRLDSGWMILDADALPDRLLGQRLDDTWTEGLAVCRYDGVLTGLALGRNKSLRPIFGELDFRTDKILGRDRPLSSGLSAYARRWTLPPGGAPSRAWIDHE